MRLKVADRAATALGMDPEAKKKAKEERQAKLAARLEEERRQKEEKAAARKAAHAEENARRERALASDKYLEGALAKLSKVRSTLTINKRVQESQRSEADRLLAEIARHQTAITEFRARLEVIRIDLQENVETSVESAEQDAVAAWDEHAAAWSVLSPGFVKKHRNRALRKQARDLGLG